MLMLALMAGMHGAMAQEVEYQMEMGAGAGACFYLGDANSKPYAHTSAMGGFIVRKIFNPRMCVKGNLAMGHLSGNSKGIYIPTDPESKTPEGGEPTQVSFQRNVLDLGAQFEMNFWGFGTGEGYKGNSRITPYALAGMGFTLAPGGGGTAFGLNLPVGVGVKYKLKPRLNVGLEWTMRFTTSDALDVSSKTGTSLSAPYGIHSIGLKNKDCYSFTMVYLTYDMCPKYRKCNN